MYIIDVTIHKLGVSIIALVSRSQTLSSQGAYRLEIISTRSERVWYIAYTFFALELERKSIGNGPDPFGAGAYNL